MKLPAAGRWRNTTVRSRLALALGLALAPVLALSAVQSAFTYSLQAQNRNQQLIGAAERSAAVVSARLASGEILLRTLSPGVIGLQCAQGLAEVKRRLPGYANLIAFDAAGRVVCSAADVPADPVRAQRPWFVSLAQGAASSASGAPGVSYAAEPSLLTSVAERDAQGRLVGVMSAVLPLASLSPEAPDSAAPSRSVVALVDGEGRFLAGANAAHFPRPSFRKGMAASPRPWTQIDRTGQRRFFIAAPLAGERLYVLLSAPYAAVSLSWLNLLAAALMPLIAFALALGAVLVVADRAVIVWIAYLRRIASIYARGRYNVHPARAADAPVEIRELAYSLDSMAQLIAKRDREAKAGLVEKDTLMREIHHRVKNNLQVISSLLSMQQRALTDPAARAAMSDTRQRITALALIYRALYQGPDLKKVDLREFMEDLIAHLVLSEVGGPAIDTRLALDELIIDPDHLAPLALFAVEAITNAKKHGLSETGGVLSVTFKVRGEEAELCITDSGRGDAEARVVGAGVGRTLMTAFARQLRGELQFNPAPGGGITARLVFPTPRRVTVN